MESTRIAHVGGFKRMSDSDSGRWMLALTWLLENATMPLGCKHEAVNLKYGRDFLAEHEQYDIVVMHDIFWGGPILKGVFRGRSSNDRALVKTSPLQSEQRWVERLSETGAKHIFIFETAPACVNGWKLGDLPGYIRKHIDTTFAVYERT